MWLFPFSIEKNQMMRKHLKHGKISVNTMMKHIHRLTILMEARMTELLPKTFSLVLEGWTAHGTHYQPIFATLPKIRF